MDCLFCNILDGKIPANIIYEDEYTIAFDDINPQAPVHKLIIPRTHIASLNDCSQENSQLLGHLMLVAKQLAKTFHVDQDGYRVVTNTQPGAGQSVFHIHYHLLGGRGMNWPPG